MILNNQPLRTYSRPTPPSAGGMETTGAIPIEIDPPSGVNAGGTTFEDEEEDPVGAFVIANFCEPMISSSVLPAAR